MWTTQNIPDLDGKQVLVTGGNSGIGYEMGLALYKAGATVTIAGRDDRKLSQAAKAIKEVADKGTIETAVLNLANLAQVKQFAQDYISTHARLDILINNAGVMMPPQSLTDDGYELQFGTNFLGHFALTGHLYTLLKQTKGARVVTLSSGAYKWATGIDYDNLRSKKSYDPVREYGISKLADMLFALELQRKMDHVGADLYSLAAHPGIVRTGLQRHIDATALNTYNDVMEPWQGALPALFAATSPEAVKGGYYGPDGEKELTGYPAPAFINETAANRAEAETLWAYAEKETGVSFENE
ncbi:oxidoreductase [Spirosoma endophyticum]|uniref:NAD(P)-dependent dehydrogenase, short-chain alcohol dehydrogenase family n=1 Tax=Spirosoma endophyticum TaxID=662367 RepID=A0A1I2BUR4_9BACT|nr:oxidoreductase [Spirosoma endophyticum]SFE59794.1 NAD(P)-dependent dehydrogenase, short-chain alcohol dehydrogenase family [Spirosoma endophyticum]